MPDQVNILEQILADKRAEIETRKCSVPADLLREQALERPTPPQFAYSLKSAPIGLIAEVKRRSPSAGMIRDPFLPAKIGRAYERAGAQAVSVLIDEKYFGGGEQIFGEVRAAIELPMLYKEFVIDEWQIWHAAKLGASAVLLIAAAMEEKRLRELMDCAAEARLEVLLEVHNAGEMALANRLGSRLTGINNRDLKTFEVSLDTSLRLKAEARVDAVIVSESGIRSNEDVQRLEANGIDAVLVGQQLLDHDKDPAVEVAKLMGR